MIQRERNGHGRQHLTFAADYGQDNVRSPCSGHAHQAQHICWHPVGAAQQWPTDLAAHPAHLCKLVCAGRRRRARQRRSAALQAEQAVRGAQHRQPFHIVAELQGPVCVWKVNDLAAGGRGQENNEVQSVA